MKISEVIIEARIFMANLYAHKKVHNNTTDLLLTKNLMSNRYTGSTWCLKYSILHLYLNSLKAERAQ